MVIGLDPSVVQEYEPHDLTSGQISPVAESKSRIEFEGLSLVTSFGYKVHHPKGCTVSANTATMWGPNVQASELVKDISYSVFVLMIYSHEFLKQREHSCCTIVDSITSCCYYHYHPRTIISE